MTQKEKALLILKTIIETSNEPLNKEYLKEKIDACLDLANPEVLLNQEEKTLFQQKVEELRKKGKII